LFPTIQLGVYVWSIKFADVRSAGRNIWRSAKTSAGALSGAVRNIETQIYALRGSSGAIQEGDTMTANDEKWRSKVKEMVAEHRELNKLIPLDTPKPRKRLPETEQWSRSEREELSRLAEAFLKAKNNTDTMHGRAQAEADEIQGRFRQIEKATVTGSDSAPAYSQLPEASPWHNDPVPPEEALGYDIHEAPIVGEPHEILDASLDGNPATSSAAPRSSGSFSPALPSSTSTLARDSGAASSVPSGGASLDPSHLPDLEHPGQNPNPTLKPRRKPL
jgi:hypothetical protein